MFIALAAHFAARNASAKTVLNDLEVFLGGFLGHVYCARLFLVTFSEPAQRGVLILFLSLSNS